MKAKTNYLAPELLRKIDVYWYSANNLWIEQGVARWGEFIVALPE